MSYTFGDSKQEIRDSLLAIDNLSGSIIYLENYAVIESNWQEGETYIGDVYDWITMYHYASIGYLSFEIPDIPEGYKIQSAQLMMFTGAMRGNSESGVYPMFNIGSLIRPEGVLEHIDYGNTFSSNDVIPSSVYGTYTFFTYETLLPPCWVSYDVSECLLMDVASNRNLSQYRVYLQGFSDWDSWNDYIATSTASATYYSNSAKVVYTLYDGVSNIDPSISQPQLAITSYPNPFSEISSISVKTIEPGLFKLNIYNIKGQLIRSYGNSSKPSGDQTFHWEGRDDTGRQVSGGIYLAVAQSGHRTASSKILYIK
jgi:hypothetical protein